MPPTNKLTEIKIRNIKPSGKIKRFVDGKGSYLEISDAGGKYWRMKYRVRCKEKCPFFGPWPEVSLKEARNTRDEVKNQLRESIEPPVEKKKASKIRRPLHFATLRWNTLSSSATPLDCRSYPHC